MSGKIPVTVITGALGSGKSSFINRLLRDGATQPEAGPPASDSVVLFNEAGQVKIDHPRVLLVNEDVSVAEAGCMCCAVRGELVLALRQLFMQALHKEIPAFSRVIIETSGQSDPAPIITTLQYERFLAERYGYESSICVINASQGGSQLRDEPQAAQQAVMADTLVLSKTDVAQPAQILQLKRSLNFLNPDAAVYDMQALPASAALFTPAPWHRSLQGAAAGDSLWTGKPLRHPVHVGISVVTLTWAQPLVRSQFNRAMHALQTDSNIKLLRVKGLLYFQGHEQPSELHGFHQQLFPMDNPGVSTSDINAAGHTDASDRHSTLLLVYRGPKGHALVELLAGLLPGASASLSPARNFVQ